LSCVLTPYPEIIGIFGELFRGSPAKKQFSLATKPFPAFRADIRKQRLAINPATKRRDSAAIDTGDTWMRTLGLILTFAFVLAGPSIAGSSDTALPGIGTFAYNGSQIVAAPHTMVVAARQGS
jgi:hypothetical protein